MITRRAAWLGIVGFLAGCGFQPVYDTGGASDGSLAAIYVPIIPDRPGQLLRQALQARLEGPASGVAKRFELAIAYHRSDSAIDVQADNSTTRTRSFGTAEWSLHPLGNNSVKLASGTARSLDGFNTIDEQFFYSDLQEDAVQRRLAASLADDIALQLSLYFRKHPEKT